MRFEGSKVITGVEFTALVQLKKVQIHVSGTAPFPKRIVLSSTMDY